MKYLYYVLAIIVGFSLLFTFFFLRPKTVPPEDLALIVNDKKISKQEYEQPAGDRMARNESEGDYLESVITRELLIQEARRQGIDKEEDFRKSIQNFYEQSLVKVLLDRQYRKFQVSVSGQELDNYKQWLESTVEFTVLTYKKLEDVGHNTPSGQETHSGPFVSFSSFVKQQLFDLQPGGQSLPNGSGDVYTVFRLDKREQLPQLNPKRKSAKDYTKELEELRREQLMNNWLHQLREKAKIVVVDNKLSSTSTAKK